MIAPSQKNQKIYNLIIIYITCLRLRLFTANHIRGFNLKFLVLIIETFIEIENI